MTTEEEKQAQRLEEILFCPRCFASSDNSSWGSDICPDYCFNCGGGPALTIPRWAVESIRQQASWVGKRYYPHDEDKELNRELKDLRGRRKCFPGRRAEPTKGEPGKWNVIQKGYDGSEHMIMCIKAKSAKDAMKQVKTLLPFVPKRRKKAA